MAHVEAHLGDVNSGGKSGTYDMRCMFEARLAGLKNIAIKHQAESLHLAIEGAADKCQCGESLSHRRFVHGLSIERHGDLCGASWIDRPHRAVEKGVHDRGAHWDFTRTE